MPASLMLFTGLVPKPSRKMAKTWDQKQTRSSPLCFKHAARQQWRNLTAGHVSAAFCHFPAAEQNVFQTVEPSLPSVSCKILLCFHPVVHLNRQFSTGILISHLLRHTLLAWWSVRVYKRQQALHSVSVLRLWTTLCLSTHPPVNRTVERVVTLSRII